MLTTSLSNSEVAFYFFVWIFSNLYSLYRLLQAQNDFLKEDQLIADDILDLNPGWSILGRFKDEADIEWITWKYYLKKYWHICLLHFGTSELIRRIKPSFLPYWQILFSSFIIMHTFNFTILLVVISQPLLYWILLHFTTLKVVIWTISILLLVGMNTLKNLDHLWEIMYDQLENDEEIYLVFISLGWTEIRCISYSMDSITAIQDSLEKQKKIPTNSLFKRKLTNLNLIDLLSYTLYFPVLFMGPIILYEDFKKSKDISYYQPLSSRLKYFGFNIFLFIFYVFFMDFLLHYFYFYALSQHNESEFLSSLPGMALCGGGLWMGVQFHLKYVVNYGIAGTFAILDHVKPPPTPRCVVRIHLYSQMWKYFDVGLYKFLVKYIYKPVLKFLMKREQKVNATKKMIATLMTFMFIYLWHGTTTSILIWTGLNFLGVQLEQLSSIIAQTKLYDRYKRSILKSEQMEERWNAFVCTPLLAMSAISNFYLFAGFDVGTSYLDRFMQESYLNIAFVMFCVYSCCQVSSILQNVPSRTFRWQIMKPYCD